VNALSLASGLLPEADREDFHKPQKTAKSLT
jgi:hypothetical protein